MKVSVVFGTRPEVIKLATLVKAFEKQSDIELNVCFTGQHKEMVLPLIDFFELKVDRHLNLMQHNQTLATLTANVVAAMDGYFAETQPDIVFVQGDTTTAMCAAMAAFYRKIKIAHVEAGLRTHNMFSPFPEEMNRSVISLMADLHFAPTQGAQNNLLRENISEDKILVTGNTVIDALLFTLQKVKQYPEYNIGTDFDNKKIVLITGHRRENFGDGFENICCAIRELAEAFPDFQFVYPVHLNPNVQEPVKRILQGLHNVQLLPPMDYIRFTQLMQKSYLILTDSGGIQEEAPVLGKPVLVMRDTTERPEAMQAGTAKLIGTTQQDIVDHVTELIVNKDLYLQMSMAVNPFGDGTAAEKIVAKTVDHVRQQKEALVG
ncbi:MAG TPA: UDP-N-acetylglucosamine 2-epimerase (non-hydrolyzing) [Flavisolibacter sp.]|nr:UDP-N-acetylglucosamine 2-epimerase (non-hydrolyzing) [Flavisolibacter sp.]